MRHVTFETAKRLAEAGFPQPEPQRGQLWYNKAGAEYIIILADNLGMCDYSISPSGKVWLGRGLNDEELFAPTATDILFHLPGWNLAYTTACGWIAYWDAPGLAEPIQFSHENPAEVCAMAWFFEQENAKK